VIFSGNAQLFPKQSAIFPSWESILGRPTVTSCSPGIYFLADYWPLYIKTAQL
jgi:hypothetical protein